MKYQEFKELLAQHPNHALRFKYGEHSFVREDFHITEIKNVTYDTVDCGGIQNKWNEVHVQLWEAEEKQADHRVNTSKALGIANAVDKVRATYAKEVVKFEYGNNSFHTAILPVNGYQVLDNVITFSLGKDSTTCKAQDRQTAAGEDVSACCSPAVGEKMKVNLSDLVSSNKCC